MPAAKIVVNGAHYDSRLYLQSHFGGRIDLSAVRELVDPDSGDNRYRAVTVEAVGNQSEIDFSSLENYIDRYGVNTGNGLWSTLNAYWGGKVVAPQLKRVGGVDIRGAVAMPRVMEVSGGRWEISTLDSVSYPELVSLTDTSLNVGSAAVDFPNLVSAKRTVFRIDDGAHVTANNLAVINGASLYVYDGSTLALPAVRHFNLETTANSQHRYFRVEGVGSRLDLSNLLSFDNNGQYDSRWYVQTFGRRSDRLGRVGTDQREPLSRHALVGRVRTG